MLVIKERTEKKRLYDVAIGCSRVTGEHLEQSGVSRKVIQTVQYFGQQARK